MNQAPLKSISRQLEDLTNWLYLLVGLPLLAFAYIYLNLSRLRPWGYFEDPDYAWWLNAAILLLALMLAVLAFILYGKRFEGLEPEADKAHGKEEGVQERVAYKFGVFKATSLQKYLILTGSTLLVVLGYFLSANAFYGAIYGILLILFSINRPTPERFMRDMRLSEKEREAFRERLRKESGAVPLKENDAKKGNKSKP